MAVVVQKYGGTSVADVERIKAVADRVRDTREAGNDIVVVVSAMGETTDRLTTLAAQITSAPTPREMDMLLTAGERITMALLAMGLHDRGIDAVSFTGSQAGILTDSSHGAARITEITGERVKEALGMGKVVIVAGFQGVDPATREVTTLGRGGSDTTAVALAATLGADSCEILTDVSGVFTADPRVVPDAVKLDAIGYVEMLELARAGAGILMPDSVSYAQAHHVAVHVRSSFTDGPGTWMRDGEVGSGVVGLAAADSGDSTTLTIVGPGAVDGLALALEILDSGGIDVVDSGHADGSSFVQVPREQSEAAQRYVHDELIRSKKAP